MTRHIARLAVLGSLIVMMTAGSHAASVITLWDFQDYYQDPVFLNWVVTPRYHPSIGSGNWSVQGTAVVDPAQQDYRDPDNPLETTSSSDPIHLINEFMGYALDLDNAPPQGTGNKTAGIRFDVSTVGYENIVVSFDIRHKYRSPRHARVQYTVDGVNWVDSLLFEADNPNEADYWYNGRTVDLSGVPGVADNPNFGFRIVAEFGPSGLYEASKTGASFRQRDLFRFDMVQVSGTVIPEPASLLTLGLGAAGLLGGIRLKRR